MYELGTQRYSKNLRLTSRLLIRMAHEPLACKKEKQEPVEDSQVVVVGDTVYSNVKYIKINGIIGTTNKIDMGMF